MSTPKIIPTHSASWLEIKPQLAPRHKRYVYIFQRSTPFILGSGAETRIAYVGSTELGLARVGASLFENWAATFDSTDPASNMSLQVHSLEAPAQATKQWWRILELDILFEHQNRVGELPPCNFKGPRAAHTTTYDCASIIEALI